MALANYNPKPLDTSSLELPAALQDVVEALAKNNHEVWAKSREAEGWSYGPARDDVKKQHPGLVPYEQLSESEKEIDRATVIQALKAAMASGVELRVTRTTPSDDIHSWPVAFPDDLQATRQVLERAFNTADTQALKHQWWHRWATRVAALFGTVAVLIAIWQLYQPGGAWAHVAEPVAAALAVVAVLLGLSLAFGPEWLLERHKAERLRLQKFRFLLDVAQCDGSVGALEICGRTTSSAVGRIETLQEPSLDLWLDEAPEPPSRSVDTGVASARLQSLAKHYLEVRADVQVEYFHKKAGHNSKWDWLTRYMPAGFFFASIVCALGHFALPLLSGSEEASRFLLFGAAALPVCGTYVRTLRGAFEYSRNTLRYRANYIALHDVAQRLRGHLAAANPQAAAIVREIEQGERILAHEHREWLRLMKEAEWFG